jgi:hypothetical protein
MKAYCVKCKKAGEMKDPKKKETKNGRWMMQGVCPVCGTKMSVFIKESDAKKKKGGDPEELPLEGGNKNKNNKNKKGGELDVDNKYVEGGNKNNKNKNNKKDDN